MFTKITTASLLTLVCASSAHAAGIFLEDFEGPAVSYTSSVAEFSDGSFDFFTRTDGSNINTSVNYGNVQGALHFAAMDLDGEGAAAIQTLTFAGIGIDFYTNLQFSGLFAEDTASNGAEDWDQSDFVKVEYQIDGAGFQNLLAFENDGSTFNSAPFEDTDFDGTGDGTELTDVLSEFSKSIAGTGSVLDLRIIMALNAGDEDIAFDNIVITGDLSVPVSAPATLWLVLAGLLGSFGISRRK